MVLKVNKPNEKKKYFLKLKFSLNFRQPPLVML